MDLMHQIASITAEVDPIFIHCIAPGRMQLIIYNFPKDVKRLKCHALHHRTGRFDLEEFLFNINSMFGPHNVFFLGALVISEVQLHPYDLWNTTGYFAMISASLIF